jgi:hypothetical protein
MDNIKKMNTLCRATNLRVLKQKVIKNYIFTFCSLAYIINYIKKNLIHIFLILEWYTSYDFHQCTSMYCTVKREFPTMSCVSSISIAVVS